MRIIGSSIGIIIGIILVWKTYPLTEFFGKIGWAEKYLSAGLGGTYFLYKIVGILLIVLSAMYMFHILDILIWPFRQLFQGLVENK